MMTKKTGLMAVVLGAALSSVSSAQASDTKAVDQLNRYCTACWRNARLPMDRWPDATQEVFRRLLERVPTKSWASLLRPETEERRELVRAIDAVKKQNQRDRLRNWQPVDDLGDDPSTREDDWEQLENASREVLTDRQREILQQTRDGSTVAEIADVMRLPADRVSDEKYKAIRKLRDYFSV